MARAASFSSCGDVGPGAPTEVEERSPRLRGVLEAEEDILVGT